MQLFLPHSLIPWTHVYEDVVQTWCCAAPTQGKQTTCCEAGCNKPAGDLGASPATHFIDPPEASLQGVWSFQGVPPSWAT